MKDQTAYSVQSDLDLHCQGSNLILLSTVGVKESKKLIPVICLAAVTIVWVTYENKR